MAHKKAGGSSRNGRDSESQAPRPQGLRWRAGERGLDPRSPARHPVPSRHERRHRQGPHAVRDGHRPREVLGARSQEQVHRLDRAGEAVTGSSPAKEPRLRTGLFSFRCPTSPSSSPPPRSSPSRRGRTSSTCSRGGAVAPAARWDRRRRIAACGFASPAASSTRARGRRRRGADPLFRARLRPGALRGRSLPRVDRHPGAAPSLGILGRRRERPEGAARRSSSRASSATC